MGNRNLDPNCESEKLLIGVKNKLEPFIGHQIKDNKKLKIKRIRGKRGGNGAFYQT